MITALDQPVKPQVFTAVSGRRKTINVLATFLVYASFVVAMVPLVWVLYTVISRGFSALVSETWFTRSMRGILPFDEGGGAYHAVVGTLMQGAVAAAFAIPVGLMVSIYLVEYSNGSRLGKITTFMVDILSGVPSIVAALFIYALWITTLGFSKSSFAVALALLLLMLPVVIRSGEEMLRIVPMDLREASYALGVPKWKTIVRIVIPTALPGIITGLMLAIARVIGEAAPLLILVGYATYINYNMVDGEMGSLPGMIITELNNPSAAGRERLWGAALTLVLIIALLNVFATLISRYTGSKTK
ncbi:phosphate ABC transporter permease PstA [Hoyosella rhizosphaerae]|uniref:Phosphate transport system permease protein PstA n=1 Tax=Hoyosella rhizosphaerae TaxID=1755582 RepID=A0A916XIQ4_9ACTN|nr:phosphate ABC transporter permease PstA [Hoyosella rhizosphaerae]MBN4928230.1 phosphate ABC transporter permease PstA [Hoyosella rhizosphaerae]GGC73394.1 phosphate transport system permease protein PstA [Hoyosella rhizosphaerae]